MTGVIGDFADGTGWVLQGQKEVAVPDVEGLTEGEARGRLSAAGLGARVRSRESSDGNAGKVLEPAGFALGGVNEVPSNTAPAGVIVGQDPGAESGASAGAPVFLTTSTGQTGVPTSVSPSASATASPSAP